MTPLTTKKRSVANARRRPKRTAKTSHTAGKSRTNGGDPKPGARSQRRGAAGGRRLSDAFDAVSRLPVLVESRRRMIVACDNGGFAPGEIAEAVESDVGLAIAVVRAANNGGAPRHRSSGIREAVETLTARGLRAVGAEVPTYDPFDAPSASSEHHERFRRHAVATRHAADRIAELARMGDRDELALAALLHDVGRLVLAELYGDFEGLDDPETTPDERIRRERRELGIDHALVGAVLVRRWGLPGGVAAAIERHHSPKAEGHAGAIRLADLIVHYAAGDPAPPEAIAAAAADVGIGRDRLIPLLYEFPYAGSPRPRPAEPCPLSDREIDALRGLAEGKVYKQIAHELSLSVSTIRTHLHNVYRKIGAVDRAQAVLIARDRGWI
jgi:putative nucleotidyltransferase with HDIG domain